MFKAIRVFNLFSIFLFAVILLLVYAYLPIQVELGIEELGRPHKQSFFYYVFFTFLTINVILRITTRVLLKQVQETMAAWAKAIIFIVNFYLTTLIGFVGVINNDTHVSMDSYLYLTWLGPAFLGIWLVGLIFLAFKKTKQSPQYQ